MLFLYYLVTLMTLGIFLIVLFFWIKVRILRRKETCKGNNWCDVMALKIIKKKYILSRDAVHEPLAFQPTKYWEKKILQKAKKNSSKMEFYLVELMSVGCKVQLNTFLWKFIHSHGLLAYIKMLYMLCAVSNSLLFLLLLLLLFLLFFSLIIIS